VRVLVNHEDVPDDRLQPLADDIATRIRRRLRYPGQVKVTVMREFRAVDFAK
jgi:ribonuclease Y